MRTKYTKAVIKHQEIREARNKILRERQSYPKPESKAKKKLAHPST